MNRSVLLLLALLILLTPGLSRSIPLLTAEQ